MTTHTYTVGERVAVTENRRVFLHTVASTKSYKRRTKVVLTDGSEWSACGEPWSCPPYCTEQLVPLTPELLAQALDQQRRAATEWVSQNWTKLPKDVRAQLGDAARAARRAQS